MQESKAEHTWAAGLGSVFPIRWPAGVNLVPDPAHAVAVGASLFGHRPAPQPVRVAASPAVSRPVPLPHSSPPAPPPPIAADPLPMLFPIPVPMPTEGHHGDPKLPDLPADWHRLIGGDPQ